MSGVSERGCGLSKGRFVMPERVCDICRRVLCCLTVSFSCLRERERERERKLVLGI